MILKYLQLYYNKLSFKRVATECDANERQSEIVKEVRVRRISIAITKAVQAARSEALQPYVYRSRNQMLPLCLRLLRIFFVRFFDGIAACAILRLPEWECYGGCLFGRRPTCTLTSLAFLHLQCVPNSTTPSTWTRKVFHIVSFTFELEHKQMTTIDDDTIQAASTTNVALRCKYRFN